jgi:hypothetical protein
MKPSCLAHRDWLSPVELHIHANATEILDAPRSGDALPRRLVGADDLEVLVDEDVVRPVDADVVDLVLAVTQLHDAINDSPRVSGQ